MTTGAHGAKRLTVIIKRLEKTNIMKERYKKMKKTNLIKIFTLVISLVLMIGVSVGITASAEESNTYEIKSININYGDTVNVLIAVDAASAENVEVMYTLGDSATEYKATYYGMVDIYNDGNSYPVYYTKGIAPRDMGEKVSAYAKVAGADVTNPEKRDISVATYFYERLYKNGVLAAKAGSVEEKQKNFYLTALEYGMWANENLYNLKNPGNERTYDITNLNYVAANNATLAYNGEAIANGSFVPVGAEVTLEYTGTEEHFNGWIACTLDKDGKLVTSEPIADGEAVTVSKAQLIVPYIKNPALVDFENYEEYTGIKAEYNATAGTNSALLSPLKSFGGELHKIDGANYYFADNIYAVSQSADTRRYNKIDDEISVRIAEDGNAYLYFTINDRDSYEGMAEGGSARSALLYFNTLDTTENNDADLTVMEMDLRIDATEDFEDGDLDDIGYTGFMVTVNVYFENGTSVARYIETRKSSDGSIDVVLRDASDNEIITLGKLGGDTGKLRVEHDKATGTSKITLGDKTVELASTASNITQLMVTDHSNSRAGLAFSIDNLILERTKAE